MSRILCIDFGKKRTGIAVTDPLQIIATGLTTVDSHELISFLKKYFQQEEVELIVIGEPKNDRRDAIGTEKSFVHFRKIFWFYQRVLVKKKESKHHNSAPIHCRKMANHSGSNYR